MLGDNSKDSADGRYFGWVPHDHLLGRAFCVWWPISRRRDLTGFTDTWWGLALLWGIPLLLVGYEMARANLFVTMRVRRNNFLGVANRRERIFINRIAFGLRLPFTSWRIWPGRLPRRGEYVAYVASHGHDGVVAAGEVLFGRVAGLPGDTVRVENGTLFIGDESTGRRVDTKAKSAFAPGRKNARVPKDSVIVISEEDDAPDSRVLGPIPRHDLVGRLSAVYWPPNRMRRIGPGNDSAQES
jgi:signal peptidase I